MEELLLTDVGQREERDSRHKLNSFNFSKFHRLLKSKQFKPVFNGTRKIRNKYLSVFAVKNNFDYPRLGLAISKKSVKLAVGRNRIKRIIRDEFRTHKDLLKGFDIIIVSKPSINDLSNSELREVLIREWGKL